MTDNNQHIVRGATGNGNSGSFAPHGHGTPEVDLDRSALDTANTAYQGNKAILFGEVASYLQAAIPDEARKVEFEEDAEMGCIVISRAWRRSREPIDTEDTDLELIDTEDDENWERWEEVNEAVGMLGDPEDAKTDFRGILTEERGDRWTWVRTQDANEADAAIIAERLEKLGNTQLDLKGESQAAAIATIKGALPEGANVVLQWAYESEGEDYLTLQEVILADKTVLSEDDEHDFDWEGINGVASDIRDVNDLSLTEVDGRQDCFTFRTPA